jgi:putative ABC transport system substrate-binding protein
MKSEFLFWFLISVWLIIPPAAKAQPTGKVFRIGYLDPSTSSSSADLVDAFRQELSKLGWIEGKNIVIEYRFAAGKNDRLPELAADLVQLKPDVITVRTGIGVLAAKQATSAIPIVMASGGDPVGIGAVKSLARPGGNVTGVSSISVELAPKRLELLKEIVPHLKRVGYLIVDGENLGTLQRVEEDEFAAQSLKIKLQYFKLKREPKALENAFEGAMREQVHAVVSGSGATLFAWRKRIAELATEHRLPLVYSQKEYVEQGGLMSYGTSFPDLFRRAAVYVDKILKGTKPADLPVEQPMKFELVINLKAAKQIGLTIPPNVLARADKVIK